MDTLICIRSNSLWRLPFLYIHTSNCFLCHFVIVTRVRSHCIMIFLSVILRISRTCVLGCCPSTTTKLCLSSSLFTFYFMIGSDWGSLAGLELLCSPRRLSMCSSFSTFQVAQVSYRPVSSSPNEHVEIKYWLFVCLLLLLFEKLTFPIRLMKLGKGL